MDIVLFFHFFLILIIGVPLMFGSLLFLIYCGLVFIFAKLRNKHTQKYHLNVIKAAILIIVIVPFSFFVNSDLSDAFVTPKLNKVFSPDGLYYAQIEEIDCGATCDFDTIATIYNAHSPFSFSSNLNSWTGNSTGVFATNGPPDSMTVSWINNDTLKVRFSDCSIINGHGDKSWKNIKIVYEGKCSKNY